MTLFEEAQTPVAVGSPVERGVGRLVPERASACGLTECHGKPMCPRCVRMADMDALCALLPEGVHWGDPLTPELLRTLLPKQIPNEFGHLLTPQALWGLYVEDSEPPNA